MEGITYPVAYQKIPIIEKMNNLRINVYGYDEDDEQISVLYISPREDPDVINVLLIADIEKQHYCLIRNFSRFLAHRTQHNGEQFYCFRCLHGFCREDLLDAHSELCAQHAAQILKMPKEDENILKFTSTHLQHPVAFTIYADFESVLEPISSVAPSHHSSYLQNTARHIPCGYAYIIVDSDGKSHKPICVYRGENAVEHFLDAILQEKEVLGKKLMEIVPMALSPQQEEDFRRATRCSICQKPLYGQRARDHDHLTGVYRGAAHMACNINYKQTKKIPVIFHNLKNYDGHHIMSKLGKYEDYAINVIAVTLEKYITFSLKKSDCPVELIFLDSFQFLPASLEKLVANLPPDQFHLLKENFPPGTNLKKLTRKGVYPYEHFSSMAVFQETQLPPSTAFFNTLTNEHVTEEDYQHAQEIWNSFRMKNLGDYHDLYVKTDVLLLADVFQNFRKLCQRYYDIDCAHVFTSAGLSWNACLKMCDVELELLTDIDMLLFVEQGVRGGVSQISHRFAKANNPKTPHFNRESPTSFIMYWDANNLYGYSMSQYLPYGGFKWVDATNFSESSILTLPDDAAEGYIFMVDLEYPSDLHDAHSDYPLAPERLTVTEDMLSPYAKSLLKNQKFKGTPKLIPNLFNKEKYVLHYRNLKLYMQLGMKLQKIHKALQFKQAPWLRKYIDFNTDKRKAATSSFEKDFFKLLNNSIYGKTIENLRKRRNIEVCNKAVRGEKLVASPNYVNFKEFDENLVAVERKKSSIFMNRPIYVGFAILELSKVLMYEYHYKFIKEHYKEKATLLFTDTDSLTYCIETPDIYKDMQANAFQFDFSEYPKDHFLYSEANKKVIGKFKDELNGEIAFEFVGLKAKMYSLKSNTSEKKRAKGISTAVVRKKLTHEDYVNCLRNETTTFEQQTRIAQQAHLLHTVQQNKKCLSPFDDKRFILEDGVTSLAYGHYRIPK